MVMADRGILHLTTGRTLDTWTAKNLTVLKRRFSAIERNWHVLVLRQIHEPEGSSYS